MELIIIEMKETATWLDRKIDELLMDGCRAEDVKKIFEDCAWIKTIFERG